MTIPTLTPPPATTPDRYGGDPVAFDAAMQAWLEWEATRQPEEVTFVDWVDATATTIDAQYTAALAAGLSNAAANAAAATTKAAEASASASTAGEQATASALSAAQSNTAKDLAITAWSASTAPAETIAALSQVMHLGAVVDVCIDRPSTHSDGGAWIDRCQALSWYTETLGGTNWLNTRCPDEATARAVIQSAVKPNLVTNGGFDVDYSGWTALAGCGLSISSKRLVITEAGTANPRAYQDITTVAGKTYLLVFDGLYISCGSVGAYAGTPASFPSQLDTGALIVTGTVKQFMFTFIAPAGTTTRISIINSCASGSAVSASFDNISVREVDTAVSAAGYVYQSTAAGTKFYGLTGASGQTEVWRGIKREYPRAGVAWVAESARVVGYDIGTGAVWMVFTSGTENYVRPSVTSIAALNGILVVGHAGAGYCATQIKFISDSAYLYYTASVYSGPYLKNTASRNASPGNAGGGSAYIVNNTVNDIAITTLDSSTIDPATGLPVPTIAFATNGDGTYSTSVFRDDGTVANIASDSTGTAVSVDFDGNALKVIRSDGTVYIWNDITGIATGTAPSQTLTAATVPALLGTVSKQATRAKGSSTGLTRIQRNPITLANSMVATAGYNFASGWQIGDSRLATICQADGVTESVVAATGLSETFATDADAAGFAAAYPGLAPIASATLDVVSGELRVTSTGGANAGCSKNITCVIGKQYRLSATMRRGTCVQAVKTDISGLTALVNSTTSNADSNLTFTATSTTHIVEMFINGAAANGETAYFDNISVKLAEPDRSVKNNGLVINGTLQKTPVAAGAALCAYSGFSAANYLEQPYNSQLDFTGDFSVIGWHYTTSASTSAASFVREGAGSVYLNVYQQGAGAFYFLTSDGSGTSNYTPAFVPTINAWYLIVATRVGGVLSVWINGILLGSSTSLTVRNLTDATGVLRLGKGAGALNSSMALWRASATVPSADQIAQIYRDELPLFQPGAQCTLAGTSPAVTALAYDDTTDILHAATSYGRSSFKNLLRVESEATTVGAPTALAASGGTVIMAGTSAKVYVPAKYLRDELQHKEEAKKALGRIPVFFDFDAVTSQVAFVLPAGYTTKAVYSAGLLKRVGSTKDYTTNSDGYKETVTFAVAPGNTVQVTVMATRILS